MDMIASVMTTRRAGRPIDFHIPSRLKSMAGDFLRAALTPDRKGGGAYTRRPLLSTRGGALWAGKFERARPIQDLSLAAGSLTGRRSCGLDARVLARDDFPSKKCRFVRASGRG